MDPFAKKMLHGSMTYAAILILMFAALTIVYLHLRPRCADPVVSEAGSPGRQWIAAIAERRCGEEAPFFTHVNLRFAGEPRRYGFFSGQANEGEIFLLEQDARSAKLSLQWTAADQLTIQCSACAAWVKREDRWGKVAIRYKLQGAL